MTDTDAGKRLSDTELEEIAADLKAADGWPWKYEQRGQMVFGHSIGGCTLTPSDYRVADVRGWGHLQYLGVERGDGKAQALQDANGKLIAKAPEYIAALLSHIAALTPTSGGNVEERARELLAVAYSTIHVSDGTKEALIRAGKNPSIPANAAILAVSQALSQSPPHACCEGMPSWRDMTFDQRRDIAVLLQQTGGARTHYENVREYLSRSHRMSEGEK